MRDMNAGVLVRFDLLSVALSLTAAHLSVLTKWMRLIAHCILIGFFLDVCHAYHHTIFWFEEFTPLGESVRLRTWIFFDLLTMKAFVKSLLSGLLWVLDVVRSILNDPKPPIKYSHYYAVFKWYGHAFHTRYHWVQAHTYQIKASLYIIRNNKK